MAYQNARSTRSSPRPSHHPTDTSLTCTTPLKECWVTQLRPLMDDQPLTETSMQAILAQLFPDPRKQKTNRKLIAGAAALTYYKQSPLAIQCLMSDDAPQFKGIAPEHASCWVHEGRHLKKLVPLAKYSRKILADFIELFWVFYRRLLAYTCMKAPAPSVAEELEKDFDQLFATVTGYADLDDCIARTKSRKAGLLLCLKHVGWLPLHNNVSELDARVQARIRDIHLRTKNAKGTKAKDTFATIVQTAKKLGVNIYDYLYDRISRTFEMDSLANLLTAAVVNARPLNSS